LKIKRIWLELLQDADVEIHAETYILPLQSQYISLLFFLIYNKDKFKLNFDIYNKNTRQKYFHLLSWNFSLYQNWIYFTGIKLLNNLPQSIQNLGNNTEQFKLALRNYIHDHSLYSINNYFIGNKDWCKINIIYIFKPKLSVLMYVTYDMFCIQRY
jgi:hypothetical protein